MTKQKEYDEVLLKLKQLEAKQEEQYLFLIDMIHNCQQAAKTMAEANAEMIRHYASNTIKKRISDELKEGY